MIRIKKVSAALAIIFAALSLAVGVSASPAAAAASCHGDWCSGRDPMSTGVGGVPCANDARTVAQVPILMNNNWGGENHIGTLELRWAGRCQANWARMSVWSGDSRLTGVTALQDTGYRQERNTQDWTGGKSPGNYYTNMIYSPVARVSAIMNVKWPSRVASAEHPNVKLGKKEIVIIMTNFWNVDPGFLLFWLTIICGSLAGIYFVKRLRLSQKLGKEVVQYIYGGLVLAAILGVIIPVAITIGYWF